MKPNINNKFLSRNKVAANKKFNKYLKYLGGGGGIIFHGLEYLIRYEVVFFNILVQLTELFTTCVKNIVFKMKVLSPGVIFSAVYINSQPDQVPWLPWNSVKFHLFHGLPWHPCFHGHQ